MPSKAATKMESWGIEASLERRWWAFKRAAGRLADRWFPSLSVASLQIDAARLASPGIPQLFSRNLRQIDPSLNDDLLDLYGRSEQVLANRFTFFNRPQEFGAEVDWVSPESPAWGTELHAFDYALDLALTYRISGEDRFARQLRYLIAHWIAENPPLEGTGWLFIPLARRARNWILVADLARADWERDPEFLRIVEDSLSVQCVRLFRLASSCRWDPRTLDDVRALLLAGKFFGGNQGAEFRSTALAMILSELDSAVHQGTGGPQRSPSSWLRLAATVLEWLLFDRGSREANLLKEKLRNVLAILEGILLPDCSLPLFGPPARDGFADVAALAAIFLEDPVWKTLAGKFGILPYMLLGEEAKICFERLPDKPWKANHCLLSESGFYRLVGSDVSALVINGQCASTPEGHMDHLSFELSIQGQRVIVDSGAYAPEGEQEEEYFSSARAHNLLLVGGQGARPCATKAGAALPLEWGPDSGITGLLLPNPGFAFLGLDHQRAWFCLDGRCWVVLDRLEGRGFPSGTSLLHFYPTFEIQCLDDRAIARSQALTVTVIPFGQPPAKIAVSRGDQGEFHGWYAPELGIKYPARVLAIEWTSIQLPWVGGQVIIPGGDAMFRAGIPDPSAGTVCLELSGKKYRLQVR